MSPQTEHVCKAVATVFGLTVAELLSTGRTQPKVFARQIATALRYAQIARKKSRKRKK